MSGALGVDWTCHLLPFHLIASDTWNGAEGEPVVPTAVHAVEDVHDTPYRIAPSAGCVNWGVRWIVQVAPFHFSARSFGAPTPMHEDREAHDTAYRLVSTTRGLGVRWIVHREPFHLSASDVVTGGAVSELPTAVHALGDVHDTP
ncbi:MAG TPA: hypothetical protein VN969_31310 [Streptosporangiaceae bacterium]|nr:hypothetical protein [Streptosporangiaceae bacterium]